MNTLFRIAAETLEDCRFMASYLTDAHKRRHWVRWCTDARYRRSAQVLNSFRVK